MKFGNLRDNAGDNNRALVLARRLAPDLREGVQSVGDFGGLLGTRRARHCFVGGFSGNKIRLSKRSRPKINNTPIMSCSLSIIVASYASADVMPTTDETLEELQGASRT